MALRHRLESPFVVTLPNRALRLFRARRSRPRVVILAKGAIGHSGAVRRTALSLHEAGYEVFVLGATRRRVNAVSSWEEDNGFKLRVVPIPGADVPRRERSARQRVARVKARRDRIRRRLSQLRQRPRTGERSSLSDRLSYRLLSYRYERANSSARRLRERERQRNGRGEAGHGDPYDLTRYEAAWWPLVRKLRPDVVHAFDVSGLTVARRAASLGARWIYEAHEAARHLGEEGRDAVRRLQVAEHASHADAVIAFTAPVADILVTDLALERPPPLVHCTPALRSGPAPRPGLREAAGVVADDPLLVYAGLLTRQRRLDVVFEAMTMLPEVRLALAVSPKDLLARGLLARSEELGVSDRVHIVPKVPPESVVPYVAEADVGVYPLGRYPAGDISLPNKLFEYLHAGLPMVVSDSPAMAGFVRRHRLGEVVPVDDAEGWARAIERALAAQPYRTRVSEWEALKEEWSWERQSERLLAVYRELLGPVPRS
jgi:glycosyltransferase involved in cell wall biosynthesis